MSNESSFIRRKRKESKFTQLSNEMLRDGRLSWKARGLLAYMLSMPDDWVFYETELVKHSDNDGITSLRSAMKELKVIGYVSKEAIKGENGKIVKWVTYVDETPIHNTGNLQCGKPTIKESHNVEDSTLLISINTNTDSTNTNNTKDIKDIVPQKQDSIDYEGLVNYLNFKTNKNYKHTTKKTRDLIKSRLNEGFTLQDFKTVIDKKCDEWLNDGYWNTFLRPETLFGNKFEGYLNQADIRGNKQGKKLDPWEAQLHEHYGSEQNTHDNHIGIPFDDKKLF